MRFIDTDWWELLEEEFKKPYYKNLREILIKEYRNKTVYPDMYSIYRALNLTSYKDTKVLILGQDPYHGRGQANGLAFSVNEGILLPPSLKNIYKELENDLGIKKHSGDLTSWAKEGVLLLNASLTVREGEANSHKSLGWSNLTDKIIQLLNLKKDPVVFILWGNDARSKKVFLNNPNHLILESVHPSPLSASRGFFGSKPFSKTNNFFISKGLSPIEW
ncbi:MAG: uracil-DNA glycosylase [Tissierellia bacterium]|nr:uracil-DNA glycosylase [Tissierellia bacterium]